MNEEGSVDVWGYEKRRGEERAGGYVWVGW